MGDFSRENAAAGQYAFQAGQARARGIQQKAQAVQQAYSLEQETAQNSYLAMFNMQAMKKNQIAAVEAALTAAGNSGFMASEGSQRGNQVAVADAWEQQIANANRSNVITDQNARAQANAYRRYGRQTMAMANIESEYYSSLAAASRSARWGYLMGDTMTLVGKLGLTYGRNSEQNGGKKNG